MKRYSFVIMLIVVLCVMLSACGENNNQPTESKQGSENVPAVSEQVDDKSASEIQDNESNANDEKSNEEVSELEVVKFDTSATIEETSLFEQNEIKIIAKELVCTDWNVTLNLYIENNSDKLATIYSGCGGYSATAINKYHVSDGYLVCELPSGTKKMEDVTFSISELQAFGINGIAEIDYGFRVDTSDNEDKYKDQEKIFMGTKSIKTSLYEKYKDSNPSIENVKNNSDITVKKTFDDSNEISEKYTVSQMIYAEHNGENTLLIELENKSDKMVIFQIDDISINGVIIYGGSYTSQNTLSMGKCCLYIDLSSLIDTPMKNIIDENNIESIGFNINVYAEDHNSTLTSPKEIEVKISDKETNVNYFENAIYDNKNIKIVSKGVAKDNYENSKDLHLVLIIQNNNAEPIDLRIKDNSFTVNGFVTDTPYFYGKVNAKKAKFLDIEIRESELEKIKVKNIEDLKSIEMVMEIKDNNRKEIDNANIKINYE